MKNRRKIFRWISLMLIGTMVCLSGGCSGKAKAANLMEGVQAEKVSGKEADADFIQSQMGFAVDLFKSSVQKTGNENILISPLSVQLALGMTANGAEGKTREEMEKLLGGALSLEELNEYLHSYVNSLPSEDEYKLEIANSIWFRNGLSVEKDFLQTNADYYAAQIYEAAFDGKTVEAVNDWVDVHTDGMIDKIVETIDPAAVMYLINALVFDAEWEEVYDKADIQEGDFTTAAGEKRLIEMMYSEESSYLEDENAVGILKPYKDSKYSFAALLPNEDMDILEYIDGLSADGLLNTLENAREETVAAAVPKFSYDYSLSMNQILAELGMPTAFDGEAADFTKIATASSANIYIGDVLHKTFISVDELGTKAGAVTKIEMREMSMMMPDKEVILNRPFVYMIIDNSTNLPVFLGAVIDVSQ